MTTFKLFSNLNSMNFNATVRAAQTLHCQPEEGSIGSYLDSKFLPSFHIDIIENRS